MNVSNKFTSHRNHHYISLKKRSLSRYYSGSHTHTHYQFPLFIALADAVPPRVALGVRPALERFISSRSRSASIFCTRLEIRVYWARTRSIIHKGTGTETPASTKPPGGRTTLAKCYNNCVASNKWYLALSRASTNTQVENTHLIILSLIFSVTILLKYFFIYGRNDSAGNWQDVSYSKCLETIPLTNYTIFLLLNSMYLSVF